MGDYRYNMSPRDYAWIQQYITRLENLEKDFRKLENKVSSLERKFDKLETILKEMRNK